MLFAAAFIVPYFWLSFDSFSDSTIFANFLDVWKALLLDYFSAVQRSELFLFRSVYRKARSAAFQAIRLLRTCKTSLRVWFFVILMAVKRSRYTKVRFIISVCKSAGVAISRSFVFRTYMAQRASFLVCEVYHRTITKSKLAYLNLRWASYSGFGPSPQLGSLTTTTFVENDSRR